MVRLVKSAFTNHVKLPMNFSKGVLSSISLLVSNSNTEDEIYYENLVNLWLSKDCDNKDKFCCSCDAQHEMVN